MLPFRDYNPSRTFPLVTITLIVANVLVFLYMVLLSHQGEGVLQAFIYRAAAIPSAILGVKVPPNYIQPPWLAVFTAMFMHGGLLHLAGNMLYLWIFGNNIEDLMGPVRFTLFYLLCGVIATGAHILSTLNTPDFTVPSLGASGAIAGVLGGYLVRFPRAQVDTCVFFIFITVIRLPALVVLALWFVLQFFSGVAALGDGARGGGTAFWAHIGGFLAGMILINLFAKRRWAEYNR